MDRPNKIIIFLCVFLTEDAHKKNFFFSRTTKKLPKPHEPLSSRGITLTIVVRPLKKTFLMFVFPYVKRQWGKIWLTERKKNKWWYFFFSLMDGRRVRSLSCGGGGRSGGGRGGGGRKYNPDTSPPIQSENPFRSQVKKQEPQKEKFAKVNTLER